MVPDNNGNDTEFDNVHQNHIAHDIETQLHLTLRPSDLADTI
jgi:hypothetical protein